MRPAGRAVERWARWRDAARRRCQVGLPVLVALGCQVAPAVPDAGAEDDDDAGRVAFTATALRSDLRPFPGVEACIPDHPSWPCGLTDDAGTATLSIPARDRGYRLAVSLRAPGYLGQTVLVNEGGPHGEAPDWGSGAFVTGVEATLQADGEVDPLLVAGGFWVPNPSTGFLLVALLDAFQQPLEGGSVSLAPPAGHGPVYFDASAHLDPALASLTSSGYALFGALAPGTYRVSTPAPCAARWLPGRMWPSPVAGSVEALAVAGTLTLAVLICE